MLLRDEILTLRDSGKIVIDQFNLRNLGTNSYDVRLGEHYFRESSSGDLVYNIYDESDVRRVWGSYLNAIEVNDDLRRTYGWASRFPVGSRVIYLTRGETILAHTEEYIGGRGSVATKMHARSSYGRNFIQVCHCAGLGDVGYVNRWTMEISNNSRHHDIPLLVGMRIAQITFEASSEVDSHIVCGYGDVSDKYQSGSDIERIKAEWNPDMMLPRLYLDWELKNRA